MRGGTIGPRTSDGNGNSDSHSDCHSDCNSFIAEAQGAQRLVPDGWLLFPKTRLGKWLRTGRPHASAPPAPLR